MIRQKTGDTREFRQMEKQYFRRFGEFLKKMQVTRVEDLVMEEREPERPPIKVSEDSLSEFLENEPDLYSLSDLKVRYNPCKSRLHNLTCEGHNACAAGCCTND